MGIASELPRNVVVYAQREGFKDGMELPCVRAADLHRLPELSPTLKSLMDGDYTRRVQEIQDVLLMNQHPPDLVFLPMQPTKRQKRYDRVQLQKLTDPDYYQRKREYEKQYRRRLREAARHMSAENLQKLQALSEADRDACLPFMH